MSESFKFNVMCSAPLLSLDLRMEPIDVICMATDSASCDFKPRRFQRRALGEYDVQIDMRFCGICHTDVHVARGETGALMPPRYPCVPGHELAGICVAVGPRVTRFRA